MWACVFCNSSLKEAVKYRVQVLLIGKHISKENVASIQPQLKQYRWERTRQNAKATCGRACSANWRSWRVNGKTDKRFYLKEPFFCQSCGESTIGGRLITLDNGYDIKICRACNRKRSTNQLHRIWAARNLEHLRIYRRLYRKKNREKMNAYKRKWRAGLETREKPVLYF